MTQISRDMIGGVGLVHNPGHCIQAAAGMR